VRTGADCATIALTGLWTTVNTPDWMTRTAATTTTIVSKFSASGRDGYGLNYDNDADPTFKLAYARISEAGTVAAPRCRTWLLRASSRRCRPRWEAGGS
jgi:hypothetical protein